ncbi:MAG: c-type cytochrome [Cytophagaceae bacterium]|nr:c-type cytochrome [Gemmatimonadaceae bacterium]
MGLRTLGLLLVGSVSCQPREEGPPPARGAISYDQHIAAGERTPTGDTLANPSSGSAEAKAMGEKLFAAMNCEGCHGTGATGFAAPSLVDGRWRYGGADAALFHSVFYGRPRGMPAYGGLMDQDAIWQVITYLTSQPIPAVVPTQAWR